MDSMISYIIVVAIVIIGVGIVLVVGTPVIDKAKSSLEFREAENFFIKLDSSIREVVKEGEGSSRLIKSSSGDFRISSEEDLIEFSQRTSLFDYLARKITNGVLLISGADVSCYEKDINNDGKQELVMENSYIAVALNKVNGTYDTKKNIVNIRKQVISINPVDSSIVIDKNINTASGTGFSYLEKTGIEFPKCRARFFMNSTLNYDIFYTLYSGADFLVVEVRNIG